MNRKKPPEPITGEARQAPAEVLPPGGGSWLCQPDGSLIPNNAPTGTTPADTAEQE